MKKYLAILAMLLVIVMALCACGGDAPATKEDSNQPSSAAPAETSAEQTVPQVTEEATTAAPPLESSAENKVPEEYVGTWIRLEKNGSLSAEFTISEDGTLSGDGNTYTLIDAEGGTLTDGENTYTSLYRIKESDWIQIYADTENDGVLLVEDSTIAETTGSPSRIYVKGREVLKRLLPEDFFGTWTVINETGFTAQHNGVPIEELTVTDDVKLRIGEEELDTFFYFNGSYSRFNCLTFDGVTVNYIDSPRNTSYIQEFQFELVLTEDGNRSEFRCEKNVEIVEITTDNWQEYFHVEVHHAVSKDSWGDIIAVYGSTMLVPNDGITILGYQDVLLQLTIGQYEFATVIYNIANDSFTIREMTEDEKTQYEVYMNSINSANADARDVQVASPEVYLGVTERCDKDGEFFAVEDGQIISPQIVSFAINVTRAKGTVYIQK